MNLNNKKILVYGLGISGKGVVRLLNGQRCSMALYDRNAELDKAALIEELKLADNTEICLGEFTEDILRNIDILALSPGVSVNAPDIVMAADKGVEILGEVELAYEISKGKLAAITGTNGKTTTTALVGEIMHAAFPEVYVVGNIGTSFASVADRTTDDSVIVAEISSFQLESIKDFHPQVSAVLNLTPDHLDRHGNFENYALCKMRIAENQNENEICVINYDDEYLRKLSEDIPASVLYFSRKEKLDYGIWISGDDIIFSDEENDNVIMKRSESELLGDHNTENIMAAIGISLAMGADPDTIAKTVRKFHAVEHRIEYVCERGGVKFYNDSKGTNTDASSKAIAAMVSPAVLIAGGYDKGADFRPWILEFNGRIKAMVLIGQTAEKIRSAAEECGYDSVYMAQDITEAVAKAYELAAPGEAVLLSPACASWGQFKNYEERGKIFKQLARDIKE